MRLAAIWLVVAAAGASEPGPVLDESVAMLEQRIGQVAAAADADQEELAERTLVELRDRLRQAGVDRTLVKALVPEWETEDEGTVPHSLARLRRLKQRLARFDEATEREPVATDDTSDRSLLQTILAQSMFESTPTEPGPLLRLRRWLGQRWMDLMRLMYGVVDANAWLVAALFGVIVVAVLAGIGYLLARTLRSGYTTPSPQLVYERTDPRTLELSALLARARTEAEAGHGVEALKLLVLAATVVLRSRGSLPAEPGLTDLEGMRILESSAPPDLRGDFCDLAALHDRGVYGGQGVDDSAVERAMQITRRIVAGAPEVAS